MADLITLASGATLKGTAGGKVYQNIKESIDVSAYDSIDFQLNLSANHGDGFTVYFITSMQNMVDDIQDDLGDPSWYSIGTVAFTGTAGTPAYKLSCVPSAPTSAPMLRYLRYYLDLGAATTVAVVTITGLARRGVRG